MFRLFFALDQTMADPSSPCEYWEAYKDEKCFEIFDKVETVENENSATLATICSKDEQRF